MHWNDGLSSNPTYYSVGPRFNLFKLLDGLVGIGRGGRKYLSGLVPTKHSSTVQKNGVNVFNSKIAFFDVFARNVFE